MCVRIVESVGLRTKGHQLVSENRTQGGHSEDLVKRCAEALDLLPLELADLLGVSYYDVLSVWTGGRSKLIALDQDIVLARLAQHVNDRIGKLLGVRQELQAKLNLDRKRRQEQRQRTLDR